MDSFCLRDKIPKSITSKELQLYHNQSRIAKKGKVAVEKTDIAVKIQCSFIFNATSQIKQIPTSRADSQIPSLDDQKR